MPIRLIAFGIMGIISVNVYYFKKKYSYWKSKEIPTLEASIFCGNLNGVGTKIHWANRLQEVYDKFKDNQVAGFYFLTTPKLIAIDLDLIKTILVTDFECFQNRGLYYNDVVDPLSGNLFYVNEEKWKNLHEKLRTEFTMDKVKLMFEKMNTNVVDLKAVLDNHVENRKVIDIRNVCVRYAADTIGSCAFGLVCGCLKAPDDSQLLEVSKEIFEFSSKRKLQFFVQNAFKNVAHRWNMRVFQHNTEEFFMEFIRNVIKSRSDNLIDHNDFMSLLIKMYDGDGLKDTEKLSFEEMAAQAFFIFFAGFETTSSAMACAMYELGKDQNMQAKAREEIEQVLENHGGEFTYDALNGMVFMKQIIKETLRFYPPVHTVFRETSDDYKLPNTDTVIEKGTGVMIPVYAIHHNSDIYSQPKLFKPDRFTPEEIEKRHKFSYLPFGAGPRNCLGMQFCELQLLRGLCEIVYNYKIRVNPKTPYPLVLDPSEFVMSTKGGIWLNVEKIR